MRKLKAVAHTAGNTSQPLTLNNKIAMKKLLLSATALAVLAALAWPKLMPDQGKNTAAERPAAPAPAVRTQRLEPRPFESRLVFNGTLRAEQSITLHSELTGKVEAIDFRDGQDVAAGDLLVTIDDDELQAALSSVHEQLGFATTNAERLQNLFSTGSVTANERDDAVSQRDVLRAELRRLQARLDKARIKAPFSGTLGLRQVSLGQLIEPNTAITTLHTLDHLQVDFSVPERYRALVSAGTHLAFSVAGQARDFEAVVRAVDPQVDVATRTLTVRADVDNSARSLLPGNYARVELVNRQEDALVVPSVAVLQSLDAISVFTVEDGIAVRRQVETGERNQSSVEILRGLEPGMEVITSGIQSIREGQPVQVLGRESVG
ncbi:efflux RND transporter periplasmic adaptor subunit [Parahaliea mediterranea]|uniref:Efflux RND transporter periplasmic adaptor subunit n=1 Tax=Parahaliea mediterranea TaxID=651086 RepID=A0A939DEX4_9GAMM|nr:efflux RND transporter periplasmic adaptor subunit [Parahaliea mediterranea]MBN7796894.1 efflux RND transporter periplasmic adaptor subunit [Parahaliea mediterranea]